MPIYEYDCENRDELISLVSDLNSDMADTHDDPDYARDPAKTPWVVTAPGTMAAGHVLVTLDALRQAAIYTVRFGGEFPTPPGEKK